MISLVTVAVFIYRKPFTHLFSAVGYGVIGSRDRPKPSCPGGPPPRSPQHGDAATVAVPGFAAYRVARWARRNPAQAAGVAAQVATAGAVAGTAGARRARPTRAGRREARRRSRGAEAGPDGSRRSAGTATAASAAARGRGRAGSNGATAGRTPPPLDLPPRIGGVRAAAAVRLGRSGATVRSACSGPAGGEPGHGSAARASRPGPAPPGCRRRPGPAGPGGGERALRAAVPAPRHRAAAAERRHPPPRASAAGPALRRHRHHVPARRTTRRDRRRRAAGRPPPGAGAAAVGAGSRRPGQRQPGCRCRPLGPVLAAPTAAPEVALRRWISRRVSASWCSLRSFSSSPRWVRS